MSFNNRSQLDPSQIQDRRGMSTGGKIALGGGGIGIIIFLVASLLGVNPSNLSSLLGSTQPQAQEAQSYTDINTQCQTGADANQTHECAIVGYVNSIQKFWTDEFAQAGSEYPLAQTVIFSDVTESGCGTASAQMGPFYCPNDKSVYLDLSFFDELQTRFGAKGGRFTEAYIIAHEYGHHVQDELGLLDMSGYQQTGPDSKAVQIELMADCLAGVWMANAQATGFIDQITKEDLVNSLDAAATMGDDKIQKQMQGYVNPDSFTHGTSEQRFNALLDGLQSGQVNTCSTPGWN